MAIKGGAPPVPLVVLAAPAAAPVVALPGDSMISKVRHDDHLAAWLVVVVVQILKEKDIALESKLLCDFASADDSG